MQGLAPGGFVSDRVGIAVVVDGPVVEVERELQGLIDLPARLPGVADDKVSERWDPGVMSHLQGPLQLRQLQPLPHHLVHHPLRQRVQRGVEILLVQPSGEEAREVPEEVSSVTTRESGT